ncbi:MAG: hypothetical protein ACRDOT_09635, partial [Aeromicrobium sp.]
HEARRFAAVDFDILLIGHAGHEEVEGTAGEAPEHVRLVEVALEAGAKASYRIDDISELDETWLDGVERVGVTSGASVPDDLVQDVLAYLADHGHPDADAVRTAEESLTFSLPPELRRDMKAAGV